MLPCSLAVGAKSSSRQIVDMFMRRMVVRGDLKTAMSSSSASSSTTRGGLMLRAKIRHGMRVLEEFFQTLAADRLGQRLQILGLTAADDLDALKRRTSGKIPRGPGPDG